MKFVHPEMLWGLLATAVPIIVHLFNFRKFKKVYFSNVEFLKEIKQETQSKRNLKHLLILASRMLAMAAIVLAFAQPYLPQPGAVEKPGGTAVSIYIDNSFSMQGAGKDGIMLDLAKNKALKIVESFSPSDKFQLLTTDFEGRHQRMVSKEEMTGLIQEVKLSPVSRKLSEVFTRQRDALFTAGLDKKHAFILTDLQASVTDTQAILNDTTMRVTVVPELPEIKGNLFIDSVWFETPVRQLNQPETLHARIVNTGSDDVETIPLQLIVNGNQKSVASASVPAGAKTIVDVTYTNTEAGIKHCSLSLTDVSITNDDSYFFSYTVADKIKVFEVLGNNASTQAVKTVFADDPFYAFHSVNEAMVDYGLFNEMNLIVVNQLRTISSGLASELTKFMEAGGSVLMIPATEIVLNDYNRALADWKAGQIGGKLLTASPVSSVNYDHRIFKEAFQKTNGNIDLPSANASYGLALTSSQWAEPLLTLQNGNPFLISSSVGSGQFYFSSVSLSPDETNFTQHALFPATLIRIAEFSQPSSKLSYFLGIEEAIVLRNVAMASEETFRLKNVQVDSELIPEHRNAGNQIEVFVHQTISQAGNYILSRAGIEVEPLAFNYDRAESQNATVSIDKFKQNISNLQFSNWSILETDIETIAADADAIDQSHTYWQSLIIWALIFLAIEILLIKFLR